MQAVLIPRIFPKKTLQFLPVFGSSWHLNPRLRRHPNPELVAHFIFRSAIERDRVLLNIPIQPPRQVVIVIRILQHGIFAGVEKLHEALPGAVVIVRAAIDDEAPFWETVVVQHVMDTLSFRCP